MTDKQENGAVVPRWDREQVNRHLLPVLRYADGLRQGEQDDQERSLALAAIAEHPEAYAQLSRVWHTGSTEILDKWFGHFACEDELLDVAFDIIDRGAPTSATETVSYDKQMYFAGLFRINDGGREVDLARPFEQYYFCDGAISADYLYRRVELGDKCKAWIRHYLPYYNRIRSWYRTNGEAESGVGYEYVAYMTLYDHFRARIAYEDGLEEERRALEYERGGLGWFHRERKREIDAELRALALRELTMRMEDATERYEAYKAQFEADREAWLNELEHAPMTAFGRKKELKSKLSALEMKLAAYRTELRLDELQEQHERMAQGRGK